MCVMFKPQEAIEEEEGTSSDEEKKVKADVSKETEKATPPAVKAEPKVVDIEETITDVAMEKKKLDKLRWELREDEL